MFWLLSACVPQAIDPPAPEAEAVPTLEERRAHYDRALEVLGTQRRALAALPSRDARRERARSDLLSAFRHAVYPAWKGTPWHFYGTTDTPGHGTIACGHLLGSWLVAMHFEVDRFTLGAQASEHIIQTFAPEDSIRRFRKRSIDEVVNAARDEGDGLYLLGLDFHAALLDVQGDEVRMCHASVFEPVSVICEDARTSPAMVSDYHVFGPLLNDAALDRWLAGGRFEVVR